MPGPPKKWSEYTAMKDVVEGTRFIPFKTPYKESVRGERFSPDVLMRRIGNLGFVLNLVKTDRFYNPVVYRRGNIQTRHFRLEGHSKLPTANEIEKIFITLKEYMKTAEDQTVLIGVHCTHGVNRTGYVICRYMIEQLGIAPEEAISRFQKARGHTFDHQEYVDDLLKLKPSVDHDSLAWHSIGGKIIPQRILDIGEDIDVDEFICDRNRRKHQTAARPEDSMDGHHSRSSDDHADRHHRRDSDHRRERDFESQSGPEDPDWLYKYVGPRRLSAPSSTEAINESELARFLGPRRRTILEEY
ncbi:RNA/RNP complex-1-interacting phosphatase-like [Tropilaelaps mercedesae]|uniref:RNA/RNP complex-1-interacting phosphatase-like n=1 Tax=Tropilaelaps mercedesae TaxID=418985 RepID=A0A1V9XL37_9ACAR|nr:RNA/RNP complex-1-interacting phosphatase-like [Tropilaelaps mercedesae]